MFDRAGLYWRRGRAAAGYRIKSGVTEEWFSAVVQRFRTIVRAAHFPHIAFDICRINRHINLPNDKIFIFW
ncbi:hypothetical protein AGR1A_Cc50533 [Agrobacterium fabacearum CFBP 5771]|nr:hypothetical protein AGR1B_Cc10070 [Agrobacterium fabacearum S56]CVI18786.1 hypothetical protein AGR1A_Cc50533 [Agrobacterium fabacearum CFBP 5771]